MNYLENFEVFKCIEQLNCKSADQVMVKTLKIKDQTSDYLR